MIYDFAVCKTCRKRTGEFRYRLRNANVWVCRTCGFHYTDYLDDIVTDASPDTSSGVSDELSHYIEHNLQSNAERFHNQVNIVRKYRSLANLRVLDVGCGGGLFLSLLKKEGAEAHGIELDPARAAYAKSKHGLSVTAIPVEADYWRTNYSGFFDVISLWDVIEHVNFPQETLCAATQLLRSDGLLLLDTPCREAFYHRCGVLTYRMTGGLFPTFLNAMYSNHPFGHKQILSTKDATNMLASAGMKVIQLDTFHELSFPYRFYLKKILRSRLLAELLHPLVVLFFTLIRIRNKMLVVAKKTSGSD